MRLLALGTMVIVPLLAGCGSSQPSETAVMRGEIHTLTRAVNDLQARMNTIKNDVCVDSTPSGDVVVPCPRSSRSYTTARY